MGDTLKFSYKYYFFCCLFFFTFSFLACSEAPPSDWNTKDGKSPNNIEDPSTLNENQNPNGNCPDGYVDNQGICFRACVESIECPKGFFCSQDKLCQTGECDPNVNEVCDDNYDNNCDGLIDSLDPSCQNGNTCQGEPPSCGICGVCATAKMRCESEVYVTCDLSDITTYQNTVELSCDDNLDNDCDCKTDLEDQDCGCNPEISAPIACPLNKIGVCKPDFRICIAGTFEPETVCDYGSQYRGSNGEKTGKVNHEGKDVCSDGLDNDCDGSIDECCPFVNCDVGTQFCKNSGELEYCVMGTDGCITKKIETCEFGCDNNECLKCENDPGCTQQGSFCESDTLLVTCTKNEDDGCLDRTESECNDGKCSPQISACCQHDSGCVQSGTFCSDSKTETACSFSSDGCLDKSDTLCQSGLCSIVTQTCCASNSCVIGEQKCNGNELEICELQADGCPGFTVTPCANGCYLDQCRLCSDALGCNAQGQYCKDSSTLVSCDFNSVTGCYEKTENPCLQGLCSLNTKSCCAHDSGCNTAGTFCSSDDTLTSCVVNSFDGCLDKVDILCTSGICSDTSNTCCSSNTCAIGDTQCKNYFQLQTCETKADGCPGFTISSCQFGCQNDQCLSCVNDPGCTQQGSFCQNNSTLVTCTQNPSDGCLDRSETKCTGGKCSPETNSCCVHDNGCFSEGLFCSNDDTLTQCIKNPADGCYDRIDMPCNNGACSVIDTPSCCLHDAGCTTETTFCSSANTQTQCELNPLTGCLERTDTLCDNGKCSSNSGFCCLNDSGCTSAGSYCNSDGTLTSCTVSADGCLDKTITACASGICPLQLNTCCPANACNVGEKSCKDDTTVSTCEIQENGCPGFVDNQCAYGCENDSCNICADDPACTSAGTYCSNNNTLITCTLASDGCLDKSVSSCASGICSNVTDSCCPADSCVLGSKKCKDDNTAEVCETQANGCPGWSLKNCEFGCENDSCNICADDPGCNNSGSYCADDNSKVTCTLGSDGCLDKNVSLCPNGKCSSQTNSCCVNDFGCNQEGSYCLNSATLVTCSVGVDGCLNRVNSACPNGKCSSQTNSCCVNDSGCTKAGSYCSSSSTQNICTVGSDGCFDLSVDQCDSNVCSTVSQTCCPDNSCTLGSQQCINNNESVVCQLDPQTGCPAWINNTCVYDSAGNIVTCEDDYECPCGLIEVSSKEFRGDFFNLSCNHPEVNLPQSQWGLKPGDSPFNHDWYDQKYYVFSLERNDLHIDYNQNYFPVNTGLCGDPYYFSAHWNTYITVTSAGYFTFTLGSDDDSWLYIDGVLQIDLGGIHGIATTSKSIYLSVGTYKIDVYFAERQVVQSGLLFDIAPGNGSAYKLGLKTCVRPADDNDKDGVSNSNDCAPLDPSRWNNCSSSCQYQDACTLHPDWAWYCDVNLQPKACGGTTTCRYKTGLHSTFCDSHSCPCPYEDLP